jgi:hypothetical protein
VEGILFAVPLQSVTGIVETFINTDRDAIVTTKMILIASAQLARISSSDATLKAALERYLSLLTDIIQQIEDIDDAVLVFDCIAQLSQVHGKEELALFESRVPVIVKNGVGSGSDVAVQSSLNCLLSMLYFLCQASADVSPILGARIVAFLPDIMRVVLEKLKCVDGILFHDLYLLKDSSNDIQLTILRFITGLYKRIPTFMTSYVQRIIHCVLDAYAARDQRQHLIDARDVLIKSITQNVPTEICVESLSACWSIVEHNRKVCSGFP